MKDNNFKEIAKDLAFTLVEIDNNQIMKLSKIIEEDAEFLREHNLMDYSLLLVIEETKQNFGGFMSINNAENYKDRNAIPSN